MKEKELVSPFGIFSTIVVSVIGIGIFAYPRNAAKLVGGDGWFTAALAGIISYILLLLVYCVVNNNEYNDFYAIFERNFGKILGKVFILFFAIYVIFAITIGLRAFIEVVKMYLLRKTPTEFLIIITMLTAFYIVRGGIQAIVKFNEISFWIMFIPMGLVLLFMFSNADFSNILPVMNHSFNDYVKSLRMAIYSFSGFEVAYIVFPIAKNRKKIKSVIGKSIAFITAFYIIIFVFTIAVLSQGQSKILLWPTITMIKTINIPGSFVERWDGVVMTLWIVFFFTTFANGFYFAADIVKNTFKLQSINISSAIIIPFLYLSALYPENIAEVYDLSLTYMPIFTGINLIAVPLLILMISYFRQQKSKGGR